MGIIGVLSTVIVIGQSTFNKTVILSNTAYDVALAIRSAETFGLGSRTTKGLLLNSGYGMHFVPLTSTFLMFADNDPVAEGCHKVPTTKELAPNATPGDCKYDPAKDALVQTYTLGNSTSVSDVCVFSASASMCSPTVRSLDIVFSRPNTTTYLSINGDDYSAAYTKAYVKLSSRGGESYVCINNTGIISVVPTADAC